MGCERQACPARHGPQGLQISCSVDGGLHFFFLAPWWTPHPPQLGTLPPHLLGCGRGGETYTSVGVRATVLPATVASSFPWVRSHWHGKSAWAVGFWKRSVTLERALPEPNMGWDSIGDGEPVNGGPRVAARQLETQGTSQSGASKRSRL